METVIKFFDFNFNASGRGRKLANNQLSVYYNKKAGTKYGATFAQNIETEFTHVKIGEIGNDICMVFSNEGIKLNKSGKNMVIFSKDFVTMMFNNELKHELERKVYDLQKVNENIYIIKNK